MFVAQSGLMNAQKVGLVNDIEHFRSFTMPKEKPEVHPVAFLYHFC
jgi:hypothetical protein